MIENLPATMGWIGKFRLFAINVMLIPAMIACSSTGRLEQQRQELGTQHNAEAQTYVFKCEDDFSFTARTDNDTAWLFLRRKTLQLQKSLSDAGVKYTDGNNLFLIKGDEATLTTGKRTFENCKNDRRTAVWEHAKLNGVDFRAVGNEPGWVLEIYDKNDIVFITDYGQSRYEFADTEVSSATQMLTTIYEGSNAQNQIEITITARRCGDSMSGDMFPVTVDVRLNKIVYRGCGKALH